MPVVRTALVTGAATGIGWTIAEGFLALGHRVCVVDRDPLALERPPEGAALLPIRADVSDPADVDRVVREVLDRFGRLDILVNNAGICPTGPDGQPKVETIAFEEWRRVFAVNLDGAFLFARAAVPAMKAQGWGRIVNISSQSARTVSKVTGAHYGASKLALVALTRSLAAELGVHGITANCVAPGWTRTALGEAVSGSEEYIRSIPIKRLGNPEDVAAAVRFLASEEAEFITGAVLDVNGGSYMA